MVRLVGGSLVAVLGQGYVGLPIAMACCATGFKVLGLDVDERKVKLLAQGMSHVDDVSSDVLGGHLASGTYRISSDYEDAEGFDVAVITVPTPLDGGRPDMRFIAQAAEKIGTMIKPGSLVILESTTYPGTTEEFLVPLLESRSGLHAGKDFYVGYSPERIDPGNKKWTLINTPKVVSGIDEASLQHVKDFYSALGISVVPVRGTREAELTKLLENTFRHVNIALVNELAVFAEHLGVNIWEAIAAATTKPFGYMPFLPGPGVGGHCLPIDPSYLSWAIEQKSGKSFRFVELANSVNQSMPHYVSGKIARMLEVSTLTNKKILIVGLAYKANTGDVRESPALEISSLLTSSGAEVAAIDSFVVDALWPPTIKRVVSTDDYVADAAVIVTDHDDTDKAGLNKLGIPILDTRNCMTGPNVHPL